MIYLLHQILIIVILNVIQLVDNQNKYSQKAITFPIELNITSNSSVVPPVIFSMRPGLVITCGLVVIIEENAENIFSIFSLSSLKYLGGFGKLGKGPNEFTTFDALSAFPSLKGLSFFETYNGLVELDLTQYFKSALFSINRNQKFPYQLQLLNDPFKLNDSVICGIPYPQPDKLVITKPYIYFNFKSNRISYFGEYPNLYPQKYNANNWLTYFHKTTLKPDGNEFASFFSQVKMFRIYKSNFTIKKELVIELQKDLFVGDWIRDNAIRYYSQVKSTNKYIYAINENEHINNLLYNKPSLEIWDWNGNPIALLHLDNPVSAFDVTKDDMKIIYIDRQSQDRIFTLDLSKILKK